MSKQGYTYILASKKHGTLYVGSTSDLIKRIHEHKNELTDGFSKKYTVKTLVHYESHDDINNAIARERQLKKWNREWKIDLIEQNNPNWNDLWNDIIK